MCAGLASVLVKSLVKVLKQSIHSQYDIQVKYAIVNALAIAFNLSVIKQELLSHFLI